MARTRTLLISILTTCSLASRDQGKSLLQQWVDLLPAYLPERFGNYEPIRLEFEQDNIDAALEHWKWPFLVKRRKPRMEGGIFMGGAAVPVHGWINLALEFHSTHPSAVIRFFKAVSAQFNAEFGLLQLAAPNQRLTVTTYQLKENIPDFYWATILGKAYVGMFSRERIVSAPACCVEELSNDLFYVQLTEDILDNETRRDEVFCARQQIKTHLDSNAFFDQSLGLDHLYSVPRFNFEPHPSRT